MISMCEQNMHQDILRIQRYLSNTGVILSYTEVAQVWEGYSASMSATWMQVPEDQDTVVALVEKYLPLKRDHLISGAVRTLNLLMAHEANKNNETVSTYKRALEQYGKTYVFTVTLKEVEK